MTDALLYYNRNGNSVISLNVTIIDNYHVKKSSPDDFSRPVQAARWTLIPMDRRNSESEQPLGCFRFNLSL